MAEMGHPPALKTNSPICKQILLLLGRWGYPLIPKSIASTGLYGQLAYGFIRWSDFRRPAGPRPCPPGTGRRCVSVSATDLADGVVLTGSQFSEPMRVVGTPAAGDGFVLVRIIAHPLRPRCRSHLSL